MARCHWHSDWDLPEGVACPDCLLKKANRTPSDREANALLKSALIAAVKTFPEKPWREHLLLIAKNYSAVLAINEARALQPPPQSKPAPKDFCLEMIPWQIDGEVLMIPVLACE